MSATVGQRVELPWRNLAGYHCFGCCPDNPAGLALSASLEGDILVCSFALDKRQESYPGVAHGGVVVAVLDELMGNLLAIAHRKACFTVSMRVRFLSPLRIGETYRASARLSESGTAADDALYDTLGEIVDVEGQAMLTASATYCWMTQAQADAFMSPSPTRSAEFTGYFRRP